MLTEFVRCILLCNSIVIDKGAFKCDSPDELCLVSYASNLKGRLLSKEGDRVCIQLNGEKEEWILYKELGFSSERKRMSVLVYNPNADRYMLYSKVRIRGHINDRVPMT